jgi:hypothetical protein
VLPVRYELNLYMLCRRKDRLCGLRSEFLATERRCFVFPVRYELNLCHIEKVDRLCGLVVIVPGYRSRGPGSIPGATELPDFLRSSGSGTGSTQPRGYN